MIKVKRERRPINQAPLSTRTNQSVHNFHLFGLKLLLLLLLEWNTLSFCLVLIFSLLRNTATSRPFSFLFRKKKHPFGRNEIPDLEEEKKIIFLQLFSKFVSASFL